MSDGVAQLKHEVTRLQQCEELLSNSSLVQGNKTQVVLAGAVAGLVSRLVSLVIILLCASLIIVQLRDCSPRRDQDPTAATSPVSHRPYQP
jgi:hypothetical protein